MGINLYLIQSYDYQRTTIKRSNLQDRPPSRQSRSASAIFCSLL